MPWERLKTLKAGKLELALDSPNVEQAIAHLPNEIELNDKPGGIETVVTVDADQIESQLRRLGPSLPLLKGRRILWVDDHPGLLLEERRLLRSLGGLPLIVLLLDLGEFRHPLFGPLPRQEGAKPKQIKAIVDAVDGRKDGDQVLEFKDGKKPPPLGRGKPGTTGVGQQVD